MNLKSLLKKQKNSYKTDKPRVRKSYYTFSREYPAGNIPIERKIHLKVKSKRTKSNLYILSLILIFCLSFCAVRFCLDISYKQPQIAEPDTEETEVVTDGDAVSSSVFYDNNMKALYMPGDKLSDTDYIKSFIKKIRRRDCNSVVIDFKTESGKLNYSSLNSYAVLGRCSVYDNNIVREALSLFKKSNVTVIARVFCFLDNTVPISSPELAVKYMDTEVNWLDATDGVSKTWLNPCSKNALLYIIDIIKEISDFGIKGFILEKCHYPDAGNIKGATFPGEKDFKNKNTALALFLNKIDSILPEDAFVIISETADDALNGNKAIYYGTSNRFNANGVAAYTIHRSTGILLDKKTQYSAVMSMLSSINENCGNKSVVPVIDIEEYSRRYMKALRDNGYQNYIIFDQSGEY